MRPGGKDEQRKGGERGGVPVEGRPHEAGAGGIKVVRWGSGTVEGPK